MNFNKINTDDLNAVLTIEIEKADYEEKVNQTLADYRKKANIPGFRKGKVPLGHIKKLYGTSVLVDEINKLVGMNIQKYLTEENVQILGEPLPSEKQEEIDWANQTEFKFSFDLGLAPEFSVSLDKRTKVPFYAIEVEEEEINKTVEMYQSQFGTMESVEQIGEESMFKASIVELDGEGAEKEEGISVDEATMSVKFVKDEEEKAKVIGSKKDDIIDIDLKKAYPSNAELKHMLQLEDDQVENLGDSFRLTVTDVTERKLAEIDQKLFDSAFGEGEVSSEEEFKNKIKEGLEARNVSEADYRFTVDFRDKYISKLSLSLPDEFLRRWISLNNKELTSEQIEKDYPAFAKDIQWQMIVGKIAKENELKLEEADVKEQAKLATRIQFQQYGINNLPEDQLEQYATMLMGNENEKRKLEERAFEQKIVAFAKEKIKLEDTPIKKEDFYKLFEDAK